MPGIADQNYLLTEQYHTARNLEARIALHARFSVNAYGWFPWLFDRLTLPQGSRVLELGCGSGRLWAQNSERIPTDWFITLTDFSPGMLTEARRALDGNGRLFEFAVADAQAIPFDDACFDAVIANHMLYHVPDLRTALMEIRRVLRPGGSFFASTIGGAHLRELHDLVPGYPDDFGAQYGFNLENGATVLAPHFGSVRLHRYEDTLVVTEAEPLIAFAYSTRVAADLDAAERAAIVRHIDHELAAHGAIHITKDSGLFEAR